MKTVIQYLVVNNNFSILITFCVSRIIHTSIICLIVFKNFLQIAEPGSPAVFAGRPGRVRRRETSGNANAGKAPKSWLVSILT